RHSEMMTIETTDDDSKEQEEAGQETELTPEMELALGKVLLPLFAEYLQEVGLLKAGEQQTHATNGRDGAMTIEETVNKLAGAQLGNAFRLSRIAVAIQQLTQTADTTNGRIDSLEEVQIHSDARLDALIDSQIQLTKRVDALNGRFDQMATRVDQVTENIDRLSKTVDAINDRFDKVAEVIEKLTAAQARADERAKLLLDHNGATKPRPKATKMTKKKTTKKAEGI